MNGDYSFDTFLQVIEFLNKNERKFEIDVNVLEMEGIDAVPHVTFKETLLFKNNKGDIPCRGDILKSLTIEGKNIRKCIVKHGEIIYQDNFNNVDKITVYLGKIGINLLNSRFSEKYIKIDADEDVTLHCSYVHFPQKTRREISTREMADDSLLGGLIYCSGVAGLYESPEDVIFDWKQCSYIRKVIDSKKKNEKVWLEEVPELMKLIKNGLDRLDIDETISGNKVTLGCYSAGESFFRHKDCPLQGGTKTLLIYLNFTHGGETMFYNEGQVIRKVTPATGRYIIFGIYDEHEMLPLNDGKKYILACELS